MGHSGEQPAVEITDGKTKISTKMSLSKLLIFNQWTIRKYSNHIQGEN